MRSINRREFLHSLAGLSGAAALLPTPASSGIEHVVVVMMENRSFDHLLGWLPNSDGRQRWSRIIPISADGFSTTAAR